MINVTKSYLPNKEKYYSYVDKIYGNCLLTNNGPLVKELEKRLKEFLGVKNIILVSNGTIALDIAYKALNIMGNVITTPFSFVATTSSLVMNGISPIFADIDKNTLNLDPNEVVKKIDKNTSAILPVHVFGNPCNVDILEKISKEHNLKLIYDGAHSFNVKYKGQSILNYGDITTLSFHATKLFHTIEGGAIITNNNSLAEHIRYLINFGIKDVDNIPFVGTNGKMNEFEAAMGLCVLDDIDIIQSKREKISKHYTSELNGLVSLQKIWSEEDVNNNYSYYPIILDSFKQLCNVKDALNKHDVYPRRYFYPSLDSLPYLNHVEAMPISRDISNRILCLPLYPDLTEHEQSLIINIIKNNL